MTDPKANPHERLDALEDSVAKLEAQLLRVSFWDVLSKQRAVNEALLNELIAAGARDRPSPALSALIDALSESLKVMDTCL